MEAFGIDTKTAIASMEGTLSSETDKISGGLSSAFGNSDSELGEADSIARRVVAQGQVEKKLLDAELTKTSARVGELSEEEQQRLQDIVVALGRQSGSANRISAERQQLFSDLSNVLGQAKDVASYVIDKRTAAVKSGRAKFDTALAQLEGAGGANADLAAIIKRSMLKNAEVARTNSTL